MTIKIIQRGTVPEDEVFSTTCHRCKTVFEFARRDAKQVNDQRDGDYLQLPCPVCDYMVTTSSRLNRQPQRSLNSGWDR